MKLSEIQKRLEEIQENSWDDETAHIREDELYSDFIKYIASGGRFAIKEKAKLILTSDKIIFSRWCA